MHFRPTLGRLLAALLLITLLPADSRAQEPKQGKPDRLLRLLPLGEAPPFQFEVVNGARVEKAAPEGSIPPLQVQVADDEGAEQGAPVRLMLDRLSGTIPVPPGRVPLHETGKGGFNPRAWHALTMPEKSTHVLALLWRDPEVKKWSSVRSMVLTDDVTSFPAGMVRFVNVSPWAVGIKFNGKNIKLPAGRQVMQGQPRAVFQQAPVEISLQDSAGAWRPVFHQAVNQGAGERTNIIVYRADGEAPRRPAKVHVLNERAVLPEPPKAEDR